MGSSRSRGKGVRKKGLVIPFERRVGNERRPWAGFGIAVREVVVANVCSFCVPVGRGCLSLWDAGNGEFLSPVFPSQIHSYT